MLFFFFSSRRRHTRSKRDWSSDVCSSDLRVPASGCTCGRTFDLYEGGIRGRVDDMKLVRGTNVYPRAVESIVREFKEIDEFRIHLYTADGRQDEIEVLIEIPEADATNADRIIFELGKSLSQAHEGL